MPTASFSAPRLCHTWRSWREAGIVDREAFRRAGEQGFLMVWPDEKYGGMGDDDFRFEQVIIEEACLRPCR
jgi:alkylation response protein AidB-like acyl-CoA dehydrogenase